MLRTLCTSNVAPIDVFFVDFVSFVEFSTDVGVFTVVLRLCSAWPTLSCRWSLAGPWCVISMVHVTIACVAVICKRLCTI